jgi:hypothetical protein
MEVAIVHGRSDMHLGEPSSGAGDISRRRLLTATAWSVPVVMVGAAAPAMAASPGFFEFAGTACKYPGNSFPQFPKSYSYGITSVNGFPFPVILAITSFKVDGIEAPNFVVICGVRGGTPCAVPPSCAPGARARLCLPPSSSLSYALIGGEYGNSQNGAATATYQVLRASDCTVISSSSASTRPNALPPCSGPAPVCL